MDKRHLVGLEGSVFAKSRIVKHSCLAKSLRLCKRPTLKENIFMYSNNIKIIIHKSCITVLSKVTSLTNKLPTSKKISQKYTVRNLIRVSYHAISPQRLGCSRLLGFTL